VTLVEMGGTGRQASWAGGGILSPLYPWRFAGAVTALAAGASGLPGLCAPSCSNRPASTRSTTRSGLLILDPEEHDEALAWAEAEG
jgi:glycine oxidase